MWFLKGRPQSIKVRAFVKSLDGGYQETNYRFTVEGESAMHIAIAFPWAPHKPNGSLKFKNVNNLTFITGEKPFIMLEENQIKVYERLRALKTLPDIELIHVQELIQWYLDDIGVITAYIEPGVTYQLNYIHKIAADSCLFLPTRLPTIIESHKPKMDYKLWVENAVLIELPKQIVRGVVSHNVNELSFKDWDWDEDTRISTDNWESSDDNYTESDED